MTRLLNLLQNPTQRVGVSRQLCILPRFQRTFVATNANGLAISYLLDPPPRGLALRRVQWQANAANERSVNAAKRLGFEFEGVVRWQRVLPSGKPHNGVPENELPEVMGKKMGPGRHTALLAICWDEWEAKRDRLWALMRS